MAESLRVFLGYTEDFTAGNYPLTAQKLLNLTAQKKFGITDHADSFLVLSDTLLLNSYDDYVSDSSTGGGSASILATIPESDESDVVLYEPNNLIYIDLKNNYDFNIRNLKFRILRNDYEKISTNGFMTMTLLIKSPNE